MRRLIVALSAAATVAGAALLTTVEPAAQGQGLAVGRPEWVPAVRHDTSRPLREMPARPPVSTREDFTVKLAPPSGQGGGQDPVTQTTTVAPLAASGGIGFDGVGEGNPQFSYNVNVAPPDTVGEAGKTQYVQWVNLSFAVFDKATGTLQYGPAAGNTIWSGFGGDCESRNDGDPIVQYDQLADRWVMTQFALRSGNYLQCVAVSATDDALGEWHRYAFSYSEFPDYPKLAVWPDAYYITFNMFGTAGTRFTGGRVCAYDRGAMLDGGPASQICAQIPYASLLASDLEGKTLPPAGTPNYVLNRGGSTSLNLWRFRPNFASPASSTFTGPTPITVASYSAACGRSCVPQPGTSQKLDALGDRLMYRLSYRNLGDRQSLVVNHSVAAGGAIGIRWYEIDTTNDAPSVRQQSTYAPADGQYRWMGSAAIDAAGNIAIGYSIGSGTLKPSIRFAGHDESLNPPNTLSLDESMQVGTGSQLSTLSRWGDYSTLSVDPVDDCTFWYTSEYLQTNGTFNWSTRIGSFRFSTCAGTAPPSTDPNFTLSASPSSPSVIQGQSTTLAVSVSLPVNGYQGAGTFSVSLPSGVTGEFSNPGYAGGQGDTNLTLTAAADAPTGSYPVTVTATDQTGSPSQSVTVTLTVAPAPDFTVSVSPSNRSVKRGRSTTFTVAVTTVSGFNEAVALTVSGGPSTGTTYEWSSDTLTGGGTSTLTIRTSGSTPRSTYTLTFTGTSGSKTRSASATLQVR